jgi:hypothetical protein
METETMIRWGKQMLAEASQYPYTPEMIDTIILMVDGKAQDEDVYRTVHEAFLIFQEHITEEGEIT